MMKAREMEQEMHCKNLIDSKPMRWNLIPVYFLIGTFTSKNKMLPAFPENTTVLQTVKAFESMTKMQTCKCNFIVPNKCRNPYSNPARSLFLRIPIKILAT